MSPLIADLLDLARWAPSGDNTQPWRFEPVGDARLRVHGFDTRAHCVYDLDGHSSQIAHGALLETLAIAASAHGMRANIVRESGSSESAPVYCVDLLPDPGLPPDPLREMIPRRSVQRRSLSTAPLTEPHRSALHMAVSPGFEVLWFEGAAKRRMAWLMFENAKLRLTLPEAYRVHRDIIEWNARFSADKVPDGALGLDPGTLKLMRWVMGSWSRVRFFNTYLAGHLVPRLEMDLLPGLRCAAHFALVAPETPRCIDDYVAAGRAVQRFWLTAAQQGLQLQPELTPLVFERYVRDARMFSQQPALVARAQSLSARLHTYLPAQSVGRVVFLGRIGYGPDARSRSLRLESRALLHRGEERDDER